MSCYDEIEWKEKRAIILQRDNYTCRDCERWNPINNYYRKDISGVYFELHTYQFSYVKHDYIYKLYSEKIMGRLGIF